LGDFFQFQGCEFTLRLIIIFTALLISNDWNTFYTSALLSLSDILAVANLKNSAKSIPPD